MSASAPSFWAILRMVDRTPLVEAEEEEEEEDAPSDPSMIRVFATSTGVVTAAAILPAMAALAPLTNPALTNSL